jgi:hypothetical protein
LKTLIPRKGQYVNAAISGTFFAINQLFLEPIPRLWNLQLAGAFFRGKEDSFVFKTH